MKQHISMHNLQSQFIETFKQQPLLVSSPGRINLIGEHTDYNYGFVMPGAIDLKINFALAKTDSELCNVIANDINDMFSFSSRTIEKSEASWHNYILGVVNRLQELTGKQLSFNCIFGGNMPIGSGMSSSAALEGGISYGLNELFNLKLSKVELAKVGQWAEHNFANVQCGIMDQFANLLGIDNNAILLDCKTLEFEFAPIELEDYEIVLLDTQVKHELGSSEYNQRKKECKEGVAFLKQKDNSIRSLRDVSIDFLNQYESEIEEPVFKRCKYVVQENMRVQAAFKALQINDIEKFGKCMFQSHEGLSKLYEVSCEELDFLVELAVEEPSIIGSRMMGGGFGGSTINLIAKDRVHYVIEEFKSKYYEKFAIELKHYSVALSDGVSTIES